MVRTRVGYCGGAKSNPTYHGMGDHTESIQVDFDPAVISYQRILEMVWQSHNPCGGQGSRQYRSAIFYDGEVQKKIAFDTRAVVELERGNVTTDVEPLKKFWVAEDYHQKYYLRSADRLMAEYAKIYDPASFRESTAAARVNAYVGGHGSRGQLEKEIEKLGLSAEGRKLLLGGYVR